MKNSGRCSPSSLSTRALSTPGPCCDPSESQKDASVVAQNVVGLGMLIIGEEPTAWVTTVSRGSMQGMFVQQSYCFSKGLGETESSVVIVTGGVGNGVLSRWLARRASFASDWSHCRTTLVTRDLCRFSLLIVVSIALP